MSSLADRYRPTELADVVGQPKACAIVHRIIERDSVGGRGYWITGSTGTGKTTIARIISDKVAGDSWGTTEEIHARTLTPTLVQKLEERSALPCFGVGGCAYIVNEAHHLRPEAIGLLLDVLERLPDHVVWIFTTTTEGNAKLFEGVEDAVPLVSRCLPIALSRQNLAKPYAARVKEIAEAEGLGGKDFGAYERAAKDERNSFRALLQRAEAGQFLKKDADNGTI